MAKQKSTSKPAVKETPKTLFYLQIPAEHPQMSPDPRLHYGLAIGHLREQIDNLESVEQLAAIDQENDTIHAMSYGITAVLKQLRDIHEHFRETNVLIRPFPAGKRGAE